MADITYGVNVEYLSAGNLSLPSTSGIDKATSAFKGLHSAAAGFNSIFDSIASSIAGVVSSIATGFGTAAAAGLALATHHAIEFNKEMEDTQTGLATIANAQIGLNGFADPKEAFGNQYRLAGDVIKQMRKDAQELPGEFKDLQNMMSLMAPAATNAGIGMFDTEKIAAKSMAAAAAMRVPFATAGREMGQMIDGHVTDRMPMFTKMGLGDSKSWNKLSQDERVSRIRAKLADMEPGLASVQKNWSTVSSNFVDNLKIGVGLVGGPLLDRVKTAMEHFNKSDKSGLATIGERVGASLVNGFDRFAGTAEAGFKDGLIAKWVSSIEEFYGVMSRGFHRVFNEFGPMMHSIMGGVHKFMNDPAAFTKIEHMLATAAALRLGSGVLSVGASAAPGALQALAASGGMGVAAELAGPIGIALGAATLAAYGFTHALIDSTSDLHNVAKSQAGLLAKNFTELSKSAEALWSAITPLLELFGVAVVWTINGFLSGINGIIDIFKELGKSVQWIIDKIPSNSKNNKLLGDDSGFAKTVGDDIENGLVSVMGMNLNPIKRFDAAVEKPTTPIVPNHTTHIHKVEIKVNSNQDPNRIAKAVHGILRSRALANTPAGQWAGNRE